MIKRVGNEDEKVQIPCISVEKASFPSPFDSGLEYSVPARGSWTIVHVGMLVPESHEIFVCAAGCLRGVVLSAAEMDITDRFSTVAIEEHNVLEGDMEELMIEGVTDILNRLPKLPKAVLVYSSCIHHFMGCDLEMCYQTLRERFPEVDFTDCYMIPTMRKSGLTPDQIMRRQIYSLLKPSEVSDKHCAIIGNCFSMNEDSDLVKLIENSGWTLHQITDCRTYEEYQEMAKCSICISTQSVAKVGGDTLEKRMGMKHIYLPLSFDFEKINKNLAMLADVLGTECKFDKEKETEAETALEKAKKIIGDTPIAVDYTFTSSPLGLVNLLISYGFNVTMLFADSFSVEEKESYLWLQKYKPDVEIYPTVNFAMRKYPCGSEQKTLALGQKAAYFTDSPYFVNLVESGGLYGFRGIIKLAELMIEAFNEPKDISKLIQIKGLGCKSCL